MNTRKMHAALKQSILEVKPALLGVVNDKNKELVCVYSQAQVEAALSRTAQQIARDFAGQTPIMICLLNGALQSFGYLTTHFGNDFNIEQDYARPSSYKDGMTAGELEWKSVGI